MRKHAPCHGKIVIQSTREIQIKSLMNFFLLIFILAVIIQWTLWEMKLSHENIFLFYAINANARLGGEKQNRERLRLRWCAKRNERQGNEAERCKSPMFNITYNEVKYDRQM